MENYSNDNLQNFSEKAETILKNYEKNLSFTNKNNKKTKEPSNNIRKSYLLQKKKNDAIINTLLGTSLLLAIFLFMFIFYDNYYLL